MKKINEFFVNNQKLIVEELIKSFFFVIVAIISVTYWEKQKILNEVSFTKKMEIIADERKSLMENADRFTESWNLIALHIGENGNNNCESSSTFNSNYINMQRISQRTSLILINRVIESEELSKAQEKLNSKTNELFTEMSDCKFNDGKYDEVCDLFDEITNIYSREIIKNLK
jgi:hypothetical protein